MRKSLLVALVCVLMPSSARDASAYAGDTHYYLRFATALETCFDWDEAHLIASADYLLDKNPTTTAEKHPFQEYNKINWHAFGGDEERFNALWERVLDEKDPMLQLVKLGQFLHFVSDWESHYGFGTRMGHGAATILGNDPDSLGNNRMNNMRMIGQTMIHMTEICVAWGRPIGDSGRDPDRELADVFLRLEGEPIMDKLFFTNSPKWKKWGRRGKKGREILERNHLLTEQFIEKWGAGEPERRIPADFAPGDLEKGLPPPLGVRYDRDGELIEVLGVEVELTPEFDGSKMSADELEAYEESLEPGFIDELQDEVQTDPDPDLRHHVELHLLDANLEDNGWTIRVEIENFGHGASPEGHIDLWVLDVISEELRGEASQPLPGLGGDTKLRKKILVESQGEPHRDILVTGSLRVPGLSADERDVWLVPWKQRIQSDERIKDRKKDRSTGAPGEIEPLSTESVGL